MTIPGPTDLDKSGNYFQTINVYLGPSLGWVPRRPGKAQLITTTGTHSVNAGVNIIYVNVAAVVTVNLPDLNDWLAQAANDAPNSYEQYVWIKDLGYNATAFNITVHPFGSQLIDARPATDFTIGQNGQLLRLYPLNDKSGWIAG
jgi:hypothetical protein